MVSKGLMKPYLDFLYRSSLNSIVIRCAEYTLLELYSTCFRTKERIFILTQNQAHLLIELILCKPHTFLKGFKGIRRPTDLSAGRYSVTICIKKLDSLQLGAKVRQPIVVSKSQTAYCYKQKLDSLLFKTQTTYYLADLSVITLFRKEI